MPETRFAVSGDRRIAYQVAGEGPPDLVYVGGWFNQVDSLWDWEPFAAFLGRPGWVLDWLASRGRVVQVR